MRREALGVKTVVCRRFPRFPWKKYYALVAAVIVAGWVIVTPSSRAASFDCEKSATPVEMMICSNETLSRLDEDLSQIYRNALEKSSDPTELKQQQHKWLFERNQCSNMSCVENSYRQRIPDLERMVNAEVQRNDQHKIELSRLVYLVNTRISKPVINHDPEICSAFLNDFKTQSRISYIQAIIEADSYEDPRFGPYRKRCPNLDWHKNVTFIPGIWDSIKDLSEEEREKYGNVSYSTSNFKLYQVDINNNPDDGDEVLFYSENYKGSSPHPAGGNYVLVNIEKCFIKGGVSTGPTVNYVTNKKIDNYSYVIAYGGQVFVLTYRSSGALQLDRYFQEYRNFTPFCTYN